MPAVIARYLRSLMWLRWRILMRSLARGRGRDVVERFSLAAESLAPIVAILLMVPAGLGLGAVGFLAGFWSGQPAGETMMTLVQVALLFTCGFTLIAPLVFPASSEASGQIRLLLLPIPRGVLYFVQTLGVLADPWLGILLPLVVTVPIGFALAGRPMAVLVALLAGPLLVGVILGLAMVTASLLQLVLRNRRRGEHLMVIAMFSFILVSMLPSLLIPEFEERKTRRRSERGAQVDRREQREDDRRLGRVMSRAALALPPGHYKAAVTAASSGRPGAAAGWLGALALTAAALHFVGWRIYRRLIETPATSGARRTRERAGPARHRILGLTAGASAVAWAFVRLVFRTPRGKIVIFGVVLMLPILSVMMMRAGGLPFLFTTLRPGFGMGIFGLAVTLLSLGPLSLNQFASDGAGLTLQSLAPISDRELLVGKAVGGALVLAGPAVFVLAIAIALSPTTPIALWLALVVGVAATYAVLAPINAALSAVFPRKVNLASIGRDSNPHQAANFLGFLAITVTAAPAALAAAAGLLLFRSHVVMLLLVATWAALAMMISSLALRFVERLIAARKENLLFVAQGR